VHDAAEGVGRDLLAAEEVLLDACAVDGGDVWSAVKAWSHALDGIEEKLGLHLARMSAVGSRLRLHGRDAVLLVAGVPRLHGAPRELEGLARLVREHLLTDVADASDRVRTGREFDGPSTRIFK
jgi:hypothetical protein